MAQHPAGEEHDGVGLPFLPQYSIQPEHGGSVQGKNWTCVHPQCLYVLRLSFVNGAQAARARKERTRQDKLAAEEAARQEVGRRSIRA
jgi:hypothetical protein